MNIKDIIKLSVLFLTLTLLSSCAEEVDESSESVQKRILEAYMNENYPGIEPTASGLYIVDSVPGLGYFPTEEAFVKVDYVITYLDGSYSSYNREDIARQLGTYSITGYYKPVIWSLADLPEGLVEILTQTRTGGSIKAVIPASLLDEESGSAITSGTGATKIYDIKIHETFYDIEKYALAEIDAYAREYHPQATTTEKGFYIRYYQTNPTDTVANSANVYVKYIGRYLDGKIFDTNVKDTAKKYGIYNENNEYGFLKYKHNETLDDAINNNSLVQGFSIALWNMNYGEHAFSFFYYDLGYGESRSGNIPAYTPLTFEIWTQKTDDE